MDRLNETPHKDVRDALVVHCDADQTWGFWVEETIGDNGFEPHRLPWSSVADDLGQAMASGVNAVDRCLVIVSEAFLAAADYSEEQWRAAMRDGATLLPQLSLVVVDRARLPEGLPQTLREQIIDVSGVGEQTARERLVEAVAGQPPNPRVPPRTRAGLPRTRFPGTEPEVWSPWTPRRNYTFIGRDNELAELHSLLWEAPRGAARVALTGLGGVGKSQIAVEYMYRYQSEYDAVWFIRATRSAVARQDLVKIAQELGVGAGEDLQANLPTVHRALRDDGLRRRWLVVIDDARSAEAIQAILPNFTGQLGHVIITSAEENWSDLATVVPVKPMEEADALRYLRSLLPKVRDEDLLELAKYCDGLPLAMDLAAAQIRGTPQSVQAYLSSTAEHGLEQFGTQLERYEKTVAQTYMTALDSVTRVQPAAGALISLLSFMASAPIPIQIFAAVQNGSHDAVLPGLDVLPRSVGNSMELRALLDEIRRHSLAVIGENRDEPTIWMHRVPQRVISACIAPEQVPLYRHVVHLMLRSRDIGAARTVAQWQTMLDVWRNLESSVGWDCPLCAADDTCRAMMLHVIRALMIWGESEHCEFAADRVIRAWTPRIGSNHTDVREATLEQANALRNQGRAAESLVLDRALEASLRESPGHGPEIEIRVGLNLGGDLRRLGAYAEAKSKDVATRDLAVRLVGPDDRLAQMARNNVSVSYLLLGEPANALANDEALLRDQERLRGNADRAFISTQTRMARANRDLGRYKIALEVQEHNESRCRSMFGGDDIVTLAAQLTLAGCLRKYGKFEESRRVAVTTATAVERILGERHPDTILALTELANCLSRSGYQDDAHEAGQRSLDLARQICGRDHPFTAVCQNNLATVLLAQGETFTAESLLNEAASVVAALPESHPHRLIVRANLASVLWTRGEYQKADAVERAVEPGFQTHLGQNHPTTLAFMTNRVTTLDRLATNDAARAQANSRWRTASDGYLRVLPREHPNVRISRERKNRIPISMDAPSV